jgi:hypothetical protein
MKKIIRGATLLVVIPLFLMIAANIASFAFYYVYISYKDTKSCTQYYTGVDKGIFWSSGSWHHYVDFKVDDSGLLHRWDITDAPLPSAFWKEYQSSSVKRVTYRWPSNWHDPFPASDWTICLKGT